MLSRAEGQGLGYLWLRKRAGVCAKEACPPAPHSQRPPRGRGLLWEGWGQLVTQESRTSWRPSGAGARPCTSHSWVLGSCESLTWHKKEKKPGGVWTQRTRVMWHPRPRPSMPRRLNSPPSAALPSPEAQLPGIAVASGVPSTPRTGSQHVSVLLLLATLPPTGTNSVEMSSGYPSARGTGPSLSTPDTSGLLAAVVSWPADSQSKPSLSPPDTSLTPAQVLSCRLHAGPVTADRILKGIS